MKERCLLLIVTSFKKPMTVRGKYSVGFFMWTLNFCHVLDICLN